MSNSASRLISLVDALNAGQTNIAAVQRWIQVLLLEGEHALDEAITAMQAALNETRAVERQMNQLGVPASLYATAIQHLRDAFNPLLANNAWQSVAANVNQPQDAIVLRWVAWATREFEEADMEGPAVEALRASIEAQERLLAEGGLTPAIHDLLLRQTTELRRALRLAAVKGPGPLRDAFNHGVTDLASVDQGTVQAMNTRDAEAVRSGVGMLRQAADAAKAGTELLDFFAKVHGTASNLLTFVQTLLPT